MSLEESRRQLADPTSSAETLAQVLAEYPVLAPQIAAHPHLDREVAGRLAALGDAEVNAVLAWRPEPGMALTGAEPSRSSGRHARAAEPAPMPAEADRLGPIKGSPYPGSTADGRRPPQEAKTGRRRSRRRMVWIAGAAVLVLAGGAGAATSYLGREPASVSVLPDDFRLRTYAAAPTERWTLGKEQILAEAQQAEPLLGGGSLVGSPGSSTGDYAAVVVEKTSSAGMEAAAVVTFSLTTGKTLWSAALPVPPAPGGDEDFYSSWTCLVTYGVVTCDGGFDADDELQSLTFDAATGAAVDPAPHAIGAVRDLTITVEHPRGQKTATFGAVRGGKPVWSTEFALDAVQLAAMDADPAALNGASLLEAADVPGDAEHVVVGFAAPTACIDTGEEGLCGDPSKTGALVFEAGSGELVGTLPRFPSARLVDDWLSIVPDEVAHSDSSVTYTSEDMDPADGTIRVSSRARMVASRLDGTQAAQFDMQVSGVMQVYGDLVLTSVDGRLTAYRQGAYDQPVWSTLVTDSYIDTITAVGGVIAASGQMQNSTDSTVLQTMGIDPATGAELWTYQGGIVGNDGTRLLLAGDFGRTMVAANPRDAREIWRYSNGSPVIRLGSGLVTSDGIGNFSGL